MEENYEVIRARERSDSCPPSPVYSSLLSPIFPEDWNAESPALPLFTLEDETPANKRTAPKEKQEVKEPVKPKQEKKKPIFKTLTEEDIKKELRAKRNREFARESRMRKQQYIEYLQTQVTQLRQLVEVYKFRLGKYELIEKYSESSVQSYFSEMEAFTSDIIKADIARKEEKAAYIKLAKERHRRFNDERRQAIEMLTKKLIEVAFPIPARISLWLNDNNVDCGCTEAMEKMFASGPPLEQFREFEKVIASFTVNQEQQLNCKKKMIKHWQRVKSIIKEIVSCEKKLQLEMKEILSFANECVIETLDTKIIEMARKMMRQIVLKPEVLKYCEWFVNDLHSEVGNSQKMGTADTEP